MSLSKGIHFEIIFWGEIISYGWGEIVVCMMASRIWTARSGVPFPAEARVFRFRKAQTVSEAHPVSYLVVTGTLPGQQSGLTVKLTTQLDL
jgi:hypothetical protein